MRHLYYYLIRPSEKLVRKLAINDQRGFAGLLQEPTLWFRDEPHRRPSDYLVEAKLLFLGFLKAEYSATPEFEEALGELEISERQFDMWWIIERYRLAKSFDDVEKWLPTSTLDQFVETKNPAIDLWISMLKETARERTE